MQQLFPSEIIHNSAENYFTQQHSTSRTVYIILVLTLLVFIILLPIIRVDITCQNNGVIRSAFDDNLIQSAVYGEVIRSNVVENLKVTQCDTLIVISTHKTDEQINYYNQELAEDSIQLRDLASLLGSQHPKLESAIFKQESIGLRGKLEEQNVKKSQAEKEYLLASTLYKKDVIPKMEFEEKKHNQEYEESRYKNISEQQKLVWQTKLTELRQKVGGLKSNIEQLKREKRQYVITAPISGTLTDCYGLKKGNFIVPNQQIGRISPDDKLLVECYVSPVNIGMITLDMAVSFQFHSYNYNQWGIGTGKVTRISNNVININDQPYFKVRCSLDQNFLTLKNGSKGFLKKGMTLTGRFMIINRSLFQLVYDKTDDWLNPKISGHE